MDERQIAVSIGARIRRARTANSMTLAALGERTNLSEAFLSRLERGEVSSSIANLLQISMALGLGVQDLVAAEKQPDKTTLAICRAADADRHEQQETTGYRWHRVAGGAPRDRMEVFHLVFPRRNKMKVMVSHPGQEHCYVLSGEIWFFVGGERHHLRAGDSIFIASEQPHRAESVGDAEAHVLMTVSKPDHEPAALDWWRMPLLQAHRGSGRSKSAMKEETP
jgi:quercetin dioxygenase-like cupin family protein